MKKFNRDGQEWYSLPYGNEVPVEEIPQMIKEVQDKYGMDLTQDEFQDKVVGIGDAVVSNYIGDWTTAGATMINFLYKRYVKKC